MLLKHPYAAGLRNGRGGAMSEIAQVMLPSGDLIWVRVQAAEPVGHR